MGSCQSVYEIAVRDENGKVKYFTKGKNYSSHSLVALIRDKFGCSLKQYFVYRSMDGFSYWLDNQQNAELNVPLHHMIVVDVKSDKTFHVARLDAEYVVSCTESACAWNCCGGNLQELIVNQQTKNNNFMQIQKVARMIRDEITKTITNKQFKVHLSNCSGNGRLNLTLLKFPDALKCDVIDNKMISLTYDERCYYFIQLAPIYDRIMKLFKFNSDVRYNIYFTRKNNMWNVYLSFCGDKNFLFPPYEKAAKEFNFGELIKKEQDDAIMAQKQRIKFVPATPAMTPAIEMVQIKDSKDASPMVSAASAAGALGNGLRILTTPLPSANVGTTRAELEPHENYAVERVKTPRVEIAAGSDSSKDVPHTEVLPPVMTVVVPPVSRAAPAPRPLNLTPNTLARTLPGRVATPHKDKNGKKTPVGKKPGKR
jgi:hypothetical protein